MRKVRRRFSIAQGNAIQGAGLLLSLVCLWAALTPSLMNAVRVVAMLVGFLLVYFCCHASAHWLVGRTLGIFFHHYSVGGSTHANAYPPPMRQLFERLPFFGVHPLGVSMRAATPTSRALMYGAGMTSSIVLPTVYALLCLIADAPGALVLFIAVVFWQMGAIASEFVVRGDFAKAAAALRENRVR